jgi:hypothetical protein
MPAGAMADQPYDVTAWTLPLQMGVEAKQIEKPFEAELKKLDSMQRSSGTILLPTGKTVTALDSLPEGIDNPAPKKRPDRGGQRFGYLILPGPNAKVTATNRFLKAGAEVYWLTEEVEFGGRRYPAGTIWVRGVIPVDFDPILGVLSLEATELSAPLQAKRVRLRAPRVGLYQPWTASMDEGWTRWLLEQYEFPYTTLHNADIKAAAGRKFDAIIFR